MGPPAVTFFANGSGGWNSKNNKKNMMSMKHAILNVKESCNNGILYPSHSGSFPANGFVFTVFSSNVLMKLRPSCS